MADTTVMPKAIEHPSEARLMARAQRRLVVQAKANGVKFRQTYERSLDGLVMQIGRYAHARYQHRRNSVEPIIGHMKHDGLLDRCHLRGREGDRIHAVLCAVGFNLRKVLRRLARYFGLRFVHVLLKLIRESGAGQRQSMNQDVTNPA